LSEWPENVKSRWPDEGDGFLGRYGVVIAVQKSFFQDLIGFQNLV